MHPRANQSPQLISLTTKTSVYNDLVVPPHSGEKPINKVREAGKVINKRYQTQCRLTSMSHIWLSYRSPSVVKRTVGSELSITQLYMRKHTRCCSLQTSTANPYSRGTSPKRYQIHQQLALLRSNGRWKSQRIQPLVLVGTVASWAFLTSAWALNDKFRFEKPRWASTQQKQVTPLLKTSRNNQKCSKIVEETDVFIYVICSWMYLHSVCFYQTSCNVIAFVTLILLGLSSHEVVNSSEWL